MVASNQSFLCIKQIYFFVRFRIIINHVLIWTQYLKLTILQIPNFLASWLHFIISLDTYHVCLHFIVLL